MSDVRGEREPDGSYAYVGTGGGMRVEVGVEDEIENDIDNALENETENEIGNALENEVGNAIENEIGNEIENEIGNDIEAELLVNDGTGRLGKEYHGMRRGEWGARQGGLEEVGV